MTKWAGWLIVFFGTAHTLGALILLGAADHMGAWLRGDLWWDDLANMSSANSALWLSLASFGPPLVLVGVLVLWLDRRSIVPPPFVAWALGVWAVLDAIILLPTPWPILLIASGLLFAATREPSRLGHSIS